MPPGTQPSTMRPLASLVRSLRKRRAERRSFAHAWPWAVFLFASAVAGKARTGPVVRLRLASDARPLAIRLLTTDVRVVKEVLVRREYDDLLVPLDAALPQAGQTPLIIDLGSNIGCSLRVWQRRWPGARIIAVEPDAGNADLCEANATGLGTGSVRVVRACIADQPGEVELSHAAGAWGVRMQAASVGTHAPRVPAITLDQLLERCADISGNAPIDLLKCDIEGAEALVFGHAGPWLARVQRLVVEVHPPYDASALARDLDRYAATLGVRFERIEGTDKAGGNALVAFVRVG